MTYQVLIEDPNGNVTLSSSTFSQWEVDEAFLHPNASRIAEFVFTSKFPNGTDVSFNVAVAPVRFHASLQGDQLLNFSLV